MKKVFILLIIIFSIVFLVSCDITQKSLDSLDQNNIPNKVTKSFVLPKGKYNDILWSSSNPKVINITNNNAQVIQQKDDVLVTLRATVNQQFKEYKVTVLKEGSPLSAYEQVISYLKDNQVITVLPEGLYVDKYVGNLYISFENSDSNVLIDYPTGVYLKYLESKQKDIKVKFYEIEKEELILIYESIITLKYYKMDVFYQLRPFATYLDTDKKYLLIKSQEDLISYMNNLDLNSLDNLYLLYLNSLKDNSSFFSSNILLLINNIQPTSSNDVILSDLYVDDKTLNVNLTTTPGFDTAIKIWSFVLEIKKLHLNIEHVKINELIVNDLMQVKISAYTYNYHYLDFLEERISVINTYQELNNYLELLKTNWEEFNKNVSNSLYFNHLLKYDESFFKKHKLILINHNASSGSFLYKYQDFKLVDNVLTINIKAYIPSLGTDDIKPWNFILVLDKTLDFDYVQLKFKY